MSAGPFRARVPRDHPCLAGHFPGRPIVPAVLILELVAAAAREKLGVLRISGVRNAKFLAPLLPGQSLQIALDGDGEQIQFRCERDGQLIAQGTLDCMRAQASGSSR